MKNSSNFLSAQTAEQLSQMQGFSLNYRLLFYVTCDFLQKRNKKILRSCDKEKRGCSWFVQVSLFAFSNLEINSTTLKLFFIRFLADFASRHCSGGYSYAHQLTANIDLKLKLNFCLAFSPTLTTRPKL